MDQLMIAISSDSGADVLLDCLNFSFQNNNSALHMELIRSYRDHIVLRISDNDHHNNNKVTWTRDVSEIIAMFIVDHMESLLLRRIIQKQSDSYEDHELTEIIQYCKQLLSDNETEAALDTEHVKQDRRLMIKEQLHKYLELNSLLDVEGFVHFRLKRYMSNLQDIVDDALDEFLLNEQYQEFIALLKYFVYFQDTKIPEVHLIHQGNNKFQLLDGDLQQLDFSDAKDVIVETVDRELNYEDMVVSALISASPKQIYIHTREPETQSIKTIQQIFEGRTWMCTCCKVCKSRLGEWKAERFT